MGKGKHKTPKEKCKAQFLRTVAKTGKWRGVLAKDYVKQKNKKRHVSRIDESINFLLSLQRNPNHRKELENKLRSKTYSLLSKDKK